MAEIIQKGRNNLAGRGEEILRLAFDSLSFEQWTAWLSAPLFGAAAEGNDVLVATILDEGAGCEFDETLGDRGETLFHAAAKGANADIVKALLKKNLRPNLDAQNLPHRETPLHIAAKHGHIKVVRALTHAGASVEAKDSYGRTPLHDACQGGHQEIAIGLLLNGALVGTPDICSFTALHLAAKEGHGAMVQLLMIASADPELRAGGRCSALDLAVARDHVEVIQKLVAYDAQVNAQCHNGTTALHVSATHGNGAAMRALIQAGALVNMGDSTGCSALHLSTSKPDLVRILLQAGANLDHRNIYGETPLFRACSQFDPGSVSTLLQLGADETVVNNKGATPFDTVLLLRERVHDTRKADEVLWLLIRTPAMRAWQRRGWLVMLRAHHHAGGMQLETDNDPGTQRSKLVAETGVERGGMDHQRSFFGVVKLLFGLEDDVFQTIALFL